MINKEKILASTVHNDKNYTCYIRLWQETLKHGLNLKKGHTICFCNLHEAHGWNHVLCWTLNIELKQNIVRKITNINSWEIWYWLKQFKIIENKEVVKQWD